MAMAAKAGTSRLMCQRLIGGNGEVIWYIIILALRKLA